MHKNKTILLVEDDSLYALTVTTWLKRAGYKVLYVSNGEQAVETVKEKNTPIDLILMDINLGSGIDGTKAAEIILKVNDIPLLFHSSHTEKEVVEKTEKITSYGYVVKDSKDVVLLASIKMAFKLHDANKKLLAQEKELHLSEEKFAKAFFSSPDAICIHRLSDKVYLEVNNGFIRLSGYTAEEVIGHSPFNNDLGILYKEDDVLKFIDNLGRHGEYADLETSFRRKDGTIRVGLLSANIIALAGEKCIITITKDITENRRIEESFKEVSKLQSLILDNSTVGIAFIHNRIFEWVNRRVAELFDLPIEKFQNASTRIIYPNDEAFEKLAREAYPQLSKGKKVVQEVEIKKSDGTLFWCKLEGKALDPDRPHDGSIWIFEDITELKRNEESIQKISELQSLILDNSTIGITLVKDRVFEWVNSRMTELFGYTMEQFKNSSTEMIYANKEAFEKLGAESYPKIIEGKKSEHELELRKNDGTLFWCRFEGKAINPTRLQDGVIWIVEDITERKLNEESIQRISKLQSLILDNSTVGIAFVNNRTFEWVNPRMEELFGYSIAEFKMFPTRNLFTKDNDYTKFGDEVYPLFAQGKKAELEIEMKRKDDSMFLCRLEGKALDSAKPYEGAIWIFEDISEKKRVLDALKESEEKFRGIFNQSPISIELFNSKGEMLDVNNTCYEIFGIKNISSSKLFNLFTDPNITDQIKTDLRNKIPVRKEITFDFEIAKKQNIYTTTKSGLHYLDLSITPLEYKDEIHDIAYLVHITDITERKLAELALSESENTFRKLFEDSSDPIILMEKNRFIECNQATLTILGLSNKEQFINSTPEDISPKRQPDGRLSSEVAEEYINKGFKEGYARFEWMSKKNDGSLLLLDIALLPITLKGKKLLHITWHDITELKRVEGELLKINKRLEIAQEQAHLGSWELNFKTKESAWSKEMFRLHGLNPNDAVPEYSDFLNRVHPTDRERIQKIIDKSLETRKPVNFEYRTNPEKCPLHTFSVSFHPVLDKEGNIVRIFGTTLDITERKYAEEALQEMNEIFNLFIKHNPVYVFIKDENCKSIYLSDNYEKMLGHPAKDLIGKDMAELFPPELAAKMIEDDKRIMREGQQCEIIEELDGRIYSTMKFPIQIKGVPKYLAGYTTDITERKQAEIQLQKYTEELKESNASKDKFFSIISHDLKNPFHSINSALKLLLSEEESLTTEERNHFLNSILNSSEKAYSLLENLLLWSRNQMGKIDFVPEEIDLDDCIANCMDILKENASIKNILFCNKVNKDIFVTADRNMLNTVIRNLLTNAIKFTGEDGKIEVQSKVIDNIVEVSVIDNGIGIAKTNIGKLFRIDQSFSTLGTKNESGTGLGLILCKEFVEKNNGEIRIESEIGKGTKITFTLPIHL